MQSCTAAEEQQLQGRGAAGGGRDCRSTSDAAAAGGVKQEGGRGGEVRHQPHVFILKDTALVKPLPLCAADRAVAAG